MYLTNPIETLDDYKTDKMNNATLTKNQNRRVIVNSYLGSENIKNTLSVSLNVNSKYKMSDSKEKNMDKITNRNVIFGENTPNKINRKFYDSYFVGGRGFYR